MITFKQNSGFLEISGLKDISVSPPVFANTATLTATLKDSAGVAVTGFNTVSGVYQVNSDGVFRFPVDGTTFNPDIGSRYKLFITGTYNTGVYEVEIVVEVVVRSTGVES
jgi:hypothetical protein